MSGLRKLAPAATAVVLLAGYAAVVALNFPGHLSVDSALQLYEGRFHVRETFGPPAYAWLLGLFDRLVAGTGAYMAASAAVLFGAWLWLMRIAGRASWLAAGVAALLILTPNLLIYQGVVWRDVLFANLAVLGFTALAAATKGWAAGTRPWPALAASVAALALAALVRQNGPLLWLFAAAVVGWAVPGRTIPHRMAWAAGWIAATAALAVALSMVAALPGPSSGAVGLRLLQFYDLAGAVKRQPDLPLPALERVDAAWTADMRSRARRLYSPERIDTFGRITIGPARAPALQEEWLRLVTRRPGLYLAVRADVLRWTLTTPRIDACLPVHVGVVGPEPQMRRLGMANETTAADQRLYNYATWFLDTPVMRHTTWLVVAGLAAVVLLLRRRPGDLAVAGMLAGSAAFAASFAAISLACDYRYLYFVDLAAMSGLFYLALGPLNLASQRSATSGRGRRAAMKR